jgi:hypothetical protein
MKITYILVALFISLAPSCFSATQVLADRESLKKFVTLSQHCHASSQATANKDAYDAFKRIKLFYLNHRNKFKKITELDEKTAHQLSLECKKTLQAALTKAVPVTTRAVTIKEMEGMALAEALEHFETKMPNLLKPTTTPLFLRRILFLTLVEVASYLTEIKLSEKTKIAHSTKDPLPINKGDAPTTNKKRPVRPMKNPLDRTKSIPEIPVLSRNGLLNMMGLAVVKTGAIALINEYSPKGISSYLHTFAEAIFPKIIAVLLLIAMKEGKLSTEQWLGASMKIIAPIILGKAFLHKSHVLYKPLQIASYAFPFVMGATAKTIYGAGFNGNGLATISTSGYVNTLTNVAIDGVLGFSIFNAVPMGIEKALPRRNMRFNPTHRRKAIKNCVRDVLDTCVKQWNKVAFSS